MSVPYVMIRSLVVILVLLVTCCDSYGVSTGNKWVSVDVAAGTGRLSLFAYPGNLANGGYYITSPDSSYLSVSIGGVSFSNNNVSKAPADHQLTDGVLIRIGDTIITRWSTPLDVDIEQRVYPEMRDLEGMIVLSIGFVNHSSTSVYCYAQYVLDVRTGDSLSPALARDISQTSKTVQYTSPSIPRFLFFTPIAMEKYRLPDRFAPTSALLSEPDLGLIEPHRITVGERNDLARYSLGWASTSQLPFQNDAILYEWSSQRIEAGESRVIARTAYGLPGVSLCTGNVLAAIFYPSTVHTVSDDTEFYVDAFLWNQTASVLKNPGATLRVGPYLAILRDSAIESSAQRASLGTDSSARGMRTARWNVRIHPQFSGYPEEATYIQIDLDGFANPPFVQPCDLPVLIDRIIPSSVGKDSIQPSFLVQQEGEWLKIEIPGEHNSRMFELFDLLGRSVFKASIHNGSVPAGFNISHLASGVYVVRLVSEGHVSSQMVRIK